MKLFNYYKNAVIYPSLFILFFSLINSTIDLLLSDYSDLLSSIISTLIFCVVMSGLALTIFLNKIKKYSTHLIWNIFTWFFLPFFYITMIYSHDINTRIKFEFGSGNDFLYLLIMTLPFIIGLIWSFTKYRQQITTTITV